MSLKTQTQAVVLATATTIIPPRLDPIEVHPPEIVRVAPARRVPLQLDAEAFHYERRPDGRILPGAPLRLRPRCSSRHGR